MKITAHIENEPGRQDVVVATNGNEQQLAIAAKPDGGSTVNGGEMLFAALATCYCNDVYREAKKRGIRVSRVTVDVDGEFADAGAAAASVRYRVSVDAEAPRDAVDELLRHTDSVAEIQKTLRNGVPVAFVMDRQS